MDKNTRKDEKVPAICPICHGTGFSKPGEICPHITGEYVGASLDFLKDIFKDIFGRFNAKNN